MKKNLLLAVLMLSTAVAYAASPYKADMKANIKAAGENGKELKKAYHDVPKEMKEGMAFLIAYMPEGDRDTLKADFLIEEVKWAYKAREDFPWAKAVPDSIFYNDVLPYASMNETREPWREMFWNKFYPLIEGMTDVYAVIDTLNQNLEKVLDVRYNTKRRKPHQSPAESIEIHMASCSGLSIIFTDVLRTFGIPSRIAGTPLWVSREGNHNWSELWIDGDWYFAEFHPTPALNKSWFLERAGKADKSNPIFWMYATSWKPTGLHFPMVWARQNKNVPGVDQTDFYINLYNAEQAEKKAGVPVTIRMFAKKDSGRSSADRVATDIRVKDKDGKMIAAGKTVGKTADMNDYLTLYLPENKDLVIEYANASGTAMESISTGMTPVEVELFLQ